LAEPGRRVSVKTAPYAPSELPPTTDEIFGISPTALLLINPDGDVCLINAAAEILLNASAHAVVGKRFAEILSLPASYDAASESAFAAYDLSVQTGRGLRFRADFLVTPFSERPGWRLVSLQAGAAAHRMGHQLDRVPARAAVRIAAMLAHEIKNPLSGIRGAAQLLDRSVTEPAMRLTRLIRDEVDRVAALIDRMEGFTDERPLPCTSENIYAIIDHARTVATSGFGDNLDIVERYDPSLPSVLVHRDSLVQIILNLLKNASETVDSGQRRRVVIATAFRHGVSFAVGDGDKKLPLPIELSISDDGPGAPLEIADHLFDPFVSAKAKGHGLGLALVDKLVRDMGGIVQYDRAGDPEMTIFRLLLPRAQETAK
jgi:two-component system, NtrC family, nitrogen regulation sensor histidine kinase GlnL